MSQRYLGGVITANPTTPTMTTESGVWTLEQQFQYSSVWSPEIVGNSLRFRASASAYLSKTFSSAGNVKTYTISFWAKRGVLSTTEYLFVGFNGSVSSQISFNSSDQLVLNVDGGSSYQIISSAVYRDPSAWYHIVATVDTTQATSSDRLKLYVNGVQLTSFSTSSYPPQNSNTYFFGATAHWIGSSQVPSQYFDGYLAEFYAVNGQALTPSSFGAFDSTGVWQPLPYTGTFGTNGFYVDFSDNSGTTSTTLGKDYSGNGNNWTPNNFSLTTGSTYDWMLDTPTNSDNGGTGRGNYAVLSPLTNGSYTTLSGGNLNTSGNTSSNNGNSRSSFAVSSGKWYMEFTVNGLYATGYPQYGIVTTADANTPNNGYPQAGYATSMVNPTASVIYLPSGNKQTNNSSTSYGSSFTTGSVIGIALDSTNGAVYFSKDGVWQNSGDPTSGATKTGAALTWTGGAYEHVISVAEFNGSGSSANFGQRPFAYTPPTGFNALNTQNLSTPTIMNGAQVMAATTYTGNGSTQTITNGGNNTIGTTFKPDFVWIKARSTTYYNNVFDSVRGASNVLFTNTSDAEATGTSYLTSFDSNGFSVGSSPGAGTNGNGVTFIGWQWQAGQGTTSSNTSGSITSTVSVNATAGFSIVTYTGTGSSGTVGHGLGVTPSMIILKNRSGVQYWFVNHTSISATQNLYLNATDSVQSDSVFSSRSSTTFGIGSNVSTSTNNYVAYCWAAVAGYSAFGSYTGNGSTDGPFVYCGFRPRFILYKAATGTAYNWGIYDTTRDTYNVASANLAPNSSAAEATAAYMDILSNGFKIRAVGNLNENGSTYIFAAFAENPFKISRAR